MGLKALRSFGIIVRRSVGTAQTSDGEDIFRQRGIYCYFLPIQTRWQDNDAYGHVNNAVYHGYFDTLINHYLLRYCELNINSLNSSMIGYIVANQCSFYRPVGYPQIPLAGMAIESIGCSSVTYRQALFNPLPSRRALPLDYDVLCDGCFPSSPLLSGFESTASTTGKSTHVFVDTATKRPTEIPTVFRKCLEKILIQPRTIHSG
ncbi:uncharacterized protein LOC103175045 [Callorhinchus milii]|uniref:Uncharacterized LOC103175045 n=1 Tax=Callorhinchus milii TaxID=7868 RepID=A0A4W3JLV2_CALMI|nr:uncharacterized protein LOC103175045 [Callorhinchus milii]|eukprot:gi/632941632/ref/XP_007885967.1/ PREDICTED: uncharacterized protein LOC103175045 [Callorhinchus milii]